MRSFQVRRSLRCDIPLRSHPRHLGLAKKYLKLGKGPNPFIDPGGYKSELDTQETAFRAVLDQQKKAVAQ